MLADTGPLVALLDKNDRHHRVCHAVMHTLPPGPLTTTWACFTEAHYILDTVGGYRFQDKLWEMRRDGNLVLLDIAANEADRMDELMAKYQDVPMDLADASLVAVAESRSIRQVFTLDSDFYLYRLADGTVLEVIR